MSRSRLIYASTMMLLATGMLGCSTSVARQDTKPVLRIQQKDFLTGELKFLGPHLRLKTAARLNVQPVGVSQYYFHEKIECWSHGKKLPGYGEGDWGGGSCKGSGDFSISLQSAEETKNKITMNSVIAITGETTAISLTGTVEIEWVKPASGLYHSFEKRLDSPIVLPTSDETSVWGYYHCNNEKSIQRDKSFEELAKTAEWAIILKVKWKEWKPSE